jgi:subtilisin family serine protease
MTERKIVRYDSLSGDQFEPPGGHGTSVASVIAGKLSGASEHEAGKEGNNILFLN